MTALLARVARNYVTGFLGGCAVAVVITAVAVWRDKEAQR